MGGWGEKHGVFLRRRLGLLVLVLLLAGCGAETDGSASSDPPLDSQEPAGASLDITKDTPDVSSVEGPGAVSVTEPPLEEPETPPAPDKDQTEPEKQERNDAYFDNALFIGDSIMEGIRQYVAAERKETETLGDAKFLTSIMGITLADLVGDRDMGLHYSYKGKEAPLKDLVPEIAPRRVFLLLGLNDLSAADPSIEESVERYSRLIDNLEEMLPEREVIVLTSPPKVASKWLPDYTANRNFSNELIEEFDLALMEMCEQRGTPCLDIHGYLVNEAGALPDDYCRDGYVHLNNAGSRVVVEALYSFAEGKQ